MSLTPLVFMLLFGAGLVAAIVRHPIWGLYTYIMTLYINANYAWWSDMVPDLRYSLIAALVTLVATLRLHGIDDRAGWLDSGAAKILVAFVVWMWIQTPWAINPEDHRNGLVVFTKVLALYYIMYRILLTPREVANFLLANVAGAAYLGYTTLGETGRISVAGAIGEANLLAMHTSVIAVFGGFLLLSLRGRWRWFLLLALPFVVNPIIQASSRGSFLGLLAAAPVALVLVPRIYRKQTIGLGILGIILFVFLAHADFWERMTSLFAVTDEDRSLDSSATTRLALMAAGWEMFLDHPIGVGYRGTEILARSYLDPIHFSNQGSRSAHSVPMAILVEHGIPGMILYLMMIGWVVTKIRSLKGVETISEELGVFRVIVGTSLMIVFVDTQFGNFLRAEVQYWCLTILVTTLEFKRLALESGAQTSDQPREPPPRGRPGYPRPGGLGQSRVAGESASSRTEAKRRVTSR